MFTKILIANRGEIACRIARTCARLGIAVATVHSSADRGALHVRTSGESIEIGGAPAAESYLNIAAVLEAARLTGAQAVHPGIGFLAENPDFALAVEAAGFTFVGPRAETLTRFGDKWTAKQEAKAAGIPVIEGSERYTDAEAIEAAVRKLKLPVLLKAVGGGGGRGVRIVREAAQARESIASAMRESQASFGRPDLLIERYLQGARHVEVQIAGDGNGGAMHLFERECSLQRRFQKIVEEAPAPGLAPALRKAILEAAVRMGAAARYRGLGTVEFLVTGDEFFFLECNPRLQVEHPVTECVTGRDLVELQLRIAGGEGLPWRQDEIACEGHAIEARIYAEATDDGFVPSTGTVLAAHFPAVGVRVDSGVDAGEVVTPYYDSMIAKLIAHGESRTVALHRLRTAVDATTLLGIETNLGYLATLLATPAVAAGAVDTGFIDRALADQSAAARTGAAAPGQAAPETGPENTPDQNALLAIAAGVVLLQQRTHGSGDPWTRYEGFTGWVLADGKGSPPRKPAFCLRSGTGRHEIAFAPIDALGWLTVAVDGAEVRLRVEPQADGRYHVSVGTRVWLVRAVVAHNAVYLHGPGGAQSCLVEPYLAAEGPAAGADGRLLAPMMGQIIRVNVRVGDQVKAADVLAVQESMKMELSIVAPWDGVVTELGCAQGDMVERNSFVAQVEMADAAAT